MLPFDDETRTVAGKSTERMHFRTKAPIKEKIQRAAALAGVDDSAFTLSAALREADRVIDAHEHTHLEAADQEAFLAALAGPSVVEEPLRIAAKRYKARVKSLQ